MRNSRIFRWMLYVFSFIGMALFVCMNLYPDRVVYKTNVIEVPGETIYQYEYEQPQLQEFGKDTLILLDKSGSMKKYITEIYLKNFEYFSGFDCWSFDTKVQTSFDLDKVKFSGNTDVLGAIEYAASCGYKNIVLFSDMEQTEKFTGEIKNPVNLIVFSPHALTEKACVDFLIENDNVLSFKQFIISGLFETEEAGIHASLFSFLK